MKTKLHPIGISSLLGLLGLVFLLFYNTPKPAQEQKNASLEKAAQAVSDLGSRLDSINNAVNEIKLAHESLAQEVAHMKTLHRETENQASAVSVKDEQPEIKQGPTDISQIYPGEKKDMESMDAAFWRGTIDPERTSDFQASIERAMSEQNITNTKLASLECREDHCRAAFVHENGANGDEFILKVIAPQAIGKPFIVETGTTSNGQEESVIYLQ